MKVRKGADVQVGVYFNSNEFDCPCNKCDTTLIDEELITKLDKLREDTSHQLFILSGYRCAAKQQQLRDRGYETAKDISQHELGKAADIKSSQLNGKQLEERAASVGFMAIGVADKWIHVDTRFGKVRRWYYARKT